MVIQKIEIKRWRGIYQECLDCGDLTVLVGRNGAGKSAFLAALDAFYDVSAPVTTADFFAFDTSEPIDIRVTFGQLNPREKEEFKGYLQHEEFVVTKRIAKENEKLVQRYYANYLQIPAFAEIRALTGKRDRQSAWNDKIKSGAFPGLTTTVTRADDIEPLMLAYEQAHPEQLIATPREEQLFGPRNIGGGKLDNYTRFVLLPAVRQASDETEGKRGVVYQLLDAIVLRKVNARADVIDLKTRFESEVKQIYSSENLTELPALGRAISCTLERIVPNTSLEFTWGDVKAPEIPLPPVKVDVVEDKFKGPITHQGHGLQRAVILALLQHLAAVTSAVQEGDGGPTSQGPDLIIAIEEPELYLHPSRCRHFADLLLELSAPPKEGRGPRNQVLYATHSPLFVDLDRFDCIRKVIKATCEHSNLFQSCVRRYSATEAKNELARISNALAGDYSEQGFLAHSLPVMTALANEGYFADVAVVVEGLGDLGALWKMQEILKQRWAALNIVIVPALGKNNIDRPTVIFRGLSIPTYFVFDADSKDKEKRDSRETIKRNHKYLRLAGVPLEDFPMTRVEAHWAVFEDDLETIIKHGFGETQFSEYKVQVAAELGYKKPDQVCKNVEGVARVIERGYKAGVTIPTLEDVVKRITALHPCNVAASVAAQEVPSASGNRQE